MEEGIFRLEVTGAFLVGHWGSAKARMCLKMHAVTLLMNGITTHIRLYQVTRSMRSMLWSTEALAIKGPKSVVVKAVSFVDSSLLLLVHV